MTNSTGKVPLSQYVLIGNYRRSKYSNRPKVLLAQYRTLVSRLTEVFPGMEITLDEYGRPRTLTRLGKGGFGQAAYFGKQDAEHSESALTKVAQQLAASFIRQSLVREFFNFEESRLHFPTVIKLPKNLGYKVVYQQQVRADKVTNAGRSRSGFVDCDQSCLEIQVRRSRKDKCVFEIVRVVSSLIHSRAISSLCFQVSLEQAKQTALLVAQRQLKMAEGQKQLVVLSAKAKANLYKGKLRPVFKIEVGLKDLSTEMPSGTPRIVEMIVDGESGQVVFARRLEMAAAARDSIATDIAGLALANVANRWQGISEQFKDIKIDSSVLAKAKDGRFILTNPWISVLYPQVDASEKMTWFDVATRPLDSTADGGTYKWKVDEPQSSGVSAYHSYMRLIKMAREEGLEIPKDKLIKVYVDHRWNRNNATFYPQYNLIQIGWGDGTYMLPHIVYDLVVCDHEYVHAIVHFLRRLEGYIPGPLGAALNEGIADFVATLMRFLKWLDYGRDGDEISLEKILVDKCVIGSYCLGGDGFRSINNNLIFPQDLKGDNKIHDNSRIVSAAMLHTFFAWLKQEVHRQPLALALPQVVRKFLRLIIAAIPMLPANRVTYSDWRKALEDADAMIFARAHHSLIADGFDPHGIKTNSLKKTA